MARRFRFRRRHPSARRAANLRKYGLSPKQAALKAERDMRALGRLRVFYMGREARFNRMSAAGFPRTRNKRHEERKLRQFTGIRAIMRQGYKLPRL